MSMPPLSRQSVRYYNTHASNYFRQTVDIDLSHLYEPFLALIPKGGHILDAGSGSGRDTKVFLERGYSVTAIDASLEMVKLSSQLTGQPTLHLSFQKMTFKECFEGIWACASLLHVPRAEIDQVFDCFVTALKPSGIWYMSFKLGSSERIAGDRFFNDYNKTLLKQLLNEYSCLKLLKIWQTSAQLPGGRRVEWINGLVNKLRE